MQMETVSKQEQERIARDDYKVWKKNCPFLYDMVITHALEWPSLTVEWLKDRTEVPDGHYSKQHMILGTHTNFSEPNHLIVAEVRLPLETTEFDADRYAEATREIGGYDADSRSKIAAKVRINHPGEVNKARACPSKKFWVATKPPDPVVLVFDWSTMPSEPDRSGEVKPLFLLEGHTQEGYGLAWSPHNKRYLASGSDDNYLCVWDLDSKPQARSEEKNYSGHKVQAQHTLTPDIRIKAHYGVVGDVQWHPRHPCFIATVGDDRDLCLWDIREVGKTQRAQTRFQVHESEANSVAWNPVHEYLIATGGSDSMVKLHDIRAPKEPFHVLSQHKDQVYGVSWMPQNESVLATSSVDRRVMLWDMARIGMELPPEDRDDGPPELLFIHGGHLSRVQDMAWNPEDTCPYVMSSVDEDNILQVWQMAENIYSDFMVDGHRTELKQP